jgi:hypothetical protein
MEVADKGLGLTAFELELRIGINSSTPRASFVIGQVPN